MYRPDGPDPMFRVRHEPPPCDLIDGQHSRVRGDPRQDCRDICTAYLEQCARNSLTASRIGDDRYRCVRGLPYHRGCQVLCAAVGENAGGGELLEKARKNRR